MNKKEIISLLKSYFQSKADKYNIDLAFLYGSWASGHPKKESDVDRELSKPMIYYNVTVHGTPIYIRAFTRFVDTKLRAIYQMEDFCMFGTKWQEEIVRKRLEALNRA